MDMQNFNSNRPVLSPLAHAPLCRDCGIPMRIASVHFTARQRQINFVCKACTAQEKESSPDLQG